MVGIDNRIGRPPASGASDGAWVSGASSDSRMDAGLRPVSGLPRGMIPLPRGLSPSGPLVDGAVGLWVVGVGVGVGSASG